MSILAHVGVKDEIEWLPRCIEHLFAIGVDQVIATDMGSGDGSLEWLQSAARRLPLRLRRMDDRHPDLLHEWCEQVFTDVRQAGADWTLFLDADEFPLPREGRLPDLASLQEADVLEVSRFNVPLGPAGPCFPPDLRPARYPDIALCVRPIPDLFERLAAGDDTPWIQGVPVPKVLARTWMMAGVSIGGHDVLTPPGSAPRRLQAPDLLIAHLPFSSRARFQAKVANLTGAIAANPSFFADRIGWHWQRWMRLWQAGALDAEFERQVFDPARLERLFAQGSVQSAADWFGHRAFVGSLP